MTTSPHPLRRRRRIWPVDRLAGTPASALDPALTAVAVPADVVLEPGNLVAVSDALGAQMFAVVDGEVTFTARSAEGERQWRGRLGARGLEPLAR